MNKIILLLLLSFYAWGMNESSDSVFKKIRKDQAKYERDSLNFVTQYKHHDINTNIQSHDFVLKENQILHISSDHELVVNHDVNNHRIDITVRVIKESK